MDREAQERVMKFLVPIVAGANCAPVADDNPESIFSKGNLQKTVDNLLKPKKLLKQPEEV